MPATLMLCWMFIALTGVVSGSAMKAVLEPEPAAG
jgi:hypothetical protein